MIKILDESKVLTELVNDNTNGLGQFQPLTAVVTEELNGIYEAEITMLDTEKHYKDLRVDGILQLEVKEKSNDSTQLFRIYYISKPINGVITIKACHITYDLNKIPVAPFEATGAVNVKNGMLRNIIGTYPYTMTTDITNGTSFFKLDIPRSFRECLGGWEGSILDTFRCEYEWNNLEVKMLAHRGSDNGVRIAYGKNLTDINQEENIENVYTAVLGYAKKNVDDVERTYVGEVYTKVQATYPRVLIVDFSSDYYDTTPTVEGLTQKAQDYANNNDIEVPNVNITVSFVPLYQTEEYKNIAPLERVNLGDTVHVYFEKLGIESTARVVKTVWDLNLNKYESVELGSVKATLSSVIDSSLNQIKNEIIDSIEVSFNAGAIEQQVQDLGNIITNGLGLHMTTVEVAGGGYRLYLHNKPNLADSDTQYTFGAEGFVVSTDYGQTWNAGFDADGNAVVNSLSTIILKALEIYGSYVMFGDPNGKYIEASTYSNSSSVPQGVSFDGSGSIRLQPQEFFYVNNLTPDGNNYYNRFVMNKNYNSTNTNNAISLMNYDDTQNYVTANFIQMDAHYTSGGATYNRLILHNYATHTGSSVSANLLMMEGRTNGSNVYLRNRKQSGTNNANELTLTYSSTQSQLTLNNYQYDSNYVSNYLQITDDNSVRTIKLTQHKPSTTVVENQISLSYGKSNDYRWVTISNGAYSSGGTTSTINYIDLYVQGEESHSYIRNRDSQGNDRNTILLDRTSSNNTIKITNYDNSGTNANYINMASNPPVLTLYSKSDIKINSGGAVRLSSSSSQDITLDAADDIYMNWVNKLRMNGKEVYLSGGYVRYYE